MLQGAQQLIDEFFPACLAPGSVDDEPFYDEVSFPLALEVVLLQQYRATQCWLGNCIVWMDGVIQAMVQPWFGFQWARQTNNWQVWPLRATTVARSKP